MCNFASFSDDNKQQWKIKLLLKFICLRLVRIMDHRNKHLPFNKIF